MILCDDKIKLRDKLNKLPNKVQKYIQEEHEKKVECDDMVGIANRVIEHNMWRAILQEDEHSVRYYKAIDELKEKTSSLNKAYEELEEYKKLKKQNIRMLRSKEKRISRLKGRITSTKKKIETLEKQQKSRHEYRIGLICGMITRRKTCDIYLNRIESEKKKEYRDMRKEERLKKSISKKHGEMDASYAMMAQYDYTMKDGEHYIVMNRERKDNPSNDVKDMIRPLTMKAAELIVNLSELKSEIYNWARWPNVYDARDMHLVGLNSYMLGHTEDVETSVFTMSSYEHNVPLYNMMRALECEISVYCKKHKLSLPTQNTIENYPDIVKNLYNQRDKLKDNLEDDYITQVIVSAELVSVARCMMLETNN